MRRHSKHQLTNQGISLIEVLISMAILASGVMAFTKTQSSLLTTGQDNLERQQAALIASDVNTLIAAHVNAGKLDASRSEIRNRINAFEKELESEAKGIAKSRGYHCDNGKPTLNADATSSSRSNSPVFQSWMTGPAFCLSISVPPNQQLDADFNGVWVQTKVSWLPLKRGDNSTDTITMSSLIAPM